MIMSYFHMGHWDNNLYNKNTRTVPVPVVLRFKFNICIS